MADPMKILFVDDEPNVLRGIRRMLHSMEGEWDIEFVTGGHKALERMAEKEFDVLVTDMRMPEMDGSQLLEEVVKKYPSTIRLVLSGQSREEVIFRTVGPAHQFLSKPCDSNVLKNTISSSLGLRRMLKSARVLKIVSRIDKLPSLPNIYIEVTEELRKEDCSMRKVADIVHRDVSMSAQILKLVNSSFFGLPNHITDIGQAVSFLGVDVLRPLVLSIGTFSQFDHKKFNARSMEEVINSSMMTASFCREIARNEGFTKEDEENMYVAGLLNEIGEIVILSELPDDYREISRKMKDENLSQFDAEEAVIGVNHGEIGAYLLGIWGLKDCITEAIAYFMRPEKCINKENSLLAILHFSWAASATFRKDAKDPEIKLLDLDYMEQCGRKDNIPVWRDICRNKFERALQ